MSKIVGTRLQRYWKMNRQLKETFWNSKISLWLSLLSVQHGKSNIGCLPAKLPIKKCMCKYIYITLTFSCIYILGYHHLAPLSIFLHFKFSLAQTPSISHACGPMPHWGQEGLMMMMISYETFYHLLYFPKTSVAVET